MAAPPATVSSVPATLDDTTLSRALPSRPVWDRSAKRLNGLNGYELYEQDTFGEKVIAEITQDERKIKQYVSQFEQWYWADDNPFGMIERAAEKFRDARRAEIKRCEETIAHCKAISGQYLAAKKAAAEANARRLQEEDRRKKEAEKAAQLAELAAQQAAAAPDKAAEIAQEMEQVEATPISVTSVSRAQASAGLPETPKGLSGRTVYLRRVVDPKAFWAWMGQHPEEAATLKLVPNFTKYKNNREKIIPGVVIEDKTESTNRGR